MSRNVLVAFLSATLIVVSGAAGALASPAAPEQVEAVTGEIERMVPELTELAADARGALTVLQSAATGLAEETPDQGRAGCQPDEVARGAALDQFRAEVAEIEEDFDGASDEAIGSLQAAAGEFATKLGAAGTADQAKAAFQNLRAALEDAAAAGGAAIDEAAAGVKSATDTAVDGLWAACAPEDQIEQLGVAADATLETLAKVDGLLDGALPTALGRLDEAERAVLAGIAAESEAEEGQEERQDDTTTTLAEDDDDRGELPFTGSPAVPLLIFGLVIAALGAILVVAGRRGEERTDS